jgi:hypothetical protein
MDEVSFWKDENSATPDVEMYRAIMPALATTRLVVQGASKLFNPSLSDELIAAQRAADPTSAASEWDALFRDDLRGFLSDDLIDAAVEHSRPLELPPRPFPMHYKAACDASGGAGLDAYTISIGHRERLGDHDFYITDLVRGTRGKFDPHEVTKQYAALLKEYRITSITGDRYSKEWVAGAWRAQNIHYIESELNKSQIYLECEPLFARGLVRLPDHPTLLRELRLLERQAHRGGRESVDHPRGSGQHDDYANSVCLVLHALSNAKGFTASDMWMANHGIE